MAHDVSMFDWCFFGVIGFSALLGAIRGLTREVLSLVSWVAAGVLTAFTYQYAQVFFYTKIANHSLADLVSLGTTFIFFLFLFSLISRYLASWIQGTIFGGVDRFLGFMFGICRGGTIFCVAEIILSFLSPRSEYPSFVLNSKSLPYLYQASDFLFEALPSNLKEYIETMRKKHRGGGSLQPHKTTSGSMTTSNTPSKLAKESAEASPLSSLASQVMKQFQKSSPEPFGTKPKEPSSTPLKNPEKISLKKAESISPSVSSNQSLKNLAEVRVQHDTSEKNDLAYSKSQEQALERLIEQYNYEEDSNNNE